MNYDPQLPGGKVYLVGAGPGDPGLITLKGLQCVVRADLLIHDGLIPPAILGYVAPSVGVVRVCRHGASAGPDGVPAAELCGRLADATAQGKVVVWLKGGDCGVLGWPAEEIEGLREVNVSYEIVPGVMPALAAAAYAEIPLTHADYASAAALVAGHPAATLSDGGALAAFPGTLVLSMESESPVVWVEALLAGGKPPSTPAVIVQQYSRPNQQIFRGTLGEAVELLRSRKVRAPAVLVVGEVAGLAPQRSWFERRPLAGTGVLVTRPEGQVEPFVQRLAALGAEVFVQPAIRIEPPDDWAAVDAALDRLDQYDWLVFSSANGVRHLLDRLWERGGDMRRLGAVKLAAIGPATAEKLASYHFRADLVPPEYRAESLAEQLARIAPHGRFLLARASRGREVLAERLQAAGGTVDQVVAYRSTDVTEPGDEVAKAVAAGRIDWITVTSSAIARALASMFGESLRHVRLASISPITSNILRELGYRPAVEAEEYTMDGLLAAMLAAPGSDRIN